MKPMTQTRRKPKIEPNAVYSCGEAAEIVGCSRDLIYRHSRGEGDLKTCELPHQRVILGSDLLDWIKSKRRTPSKDAAD